MGVWILTDQRAARAVLYDSTRERPIECSGFIGDDAEDQAESFLQYLTEKGTPDAGELADDPRCYSPRALVAHYDAWHKGFMADDGLTLAGWNMRDRYGRR